MRRLTLTLASLVIAGTAKASILCNAPLVLQGDRRSSTTPSVQVEITHDDKTKAWKVFHRLADGTVASRSDEFNIKDKSATNARQWGGTDLRDPTKFMVGELRLTHDQLYYFERLYIGNVKVMTSISKCPSPPEERQAEVTPKPIPTRPVIKQGEVGSTKDSVPIYPGNEGQSVLIDVTLGGNPVRMVLDTGATMSQIRADLASKIVRQRQGSWGGWMTYRLADGSEGRSRVLTVEEVRIGRHVLRNVRAGVQDRGDLLLAFPVINEIAPFKIDTRNKELVFETTEAKR